MYMHDAEWDENEPKDVARPSDGPESALFYRHTADAARSIMERAGIVYTSAGFWNPATGGTAALSDHDLIVPSYVGWHKVFGVIVDFFPRGWAPDQWGHLCQTGTTKRPSAAGGWGSVTGWQFSAGGNAQGRVYGCRSTDLDLNIIDPAAVARWLGSTLDRPPVDPPVIINPTPGWHPPAGIPEEDDDMARVGPYFVRKTGTPEVFLTDGRMMTRRHIGSPDELRDVQWQFVNANHPADAVNAIVEVDDLDAFGVDISR
jgi:hypothetical protein